MWWTRYLSPRRSASSMKCVDIIIVRLALCLISKFQMPLLENRMDWYQKSINRKREPTPGISLKIKITGVKSQVMQLYSIFDIKMMGKSNSIELFFKSYVLLQPLSLVRPSLLFSRNYIKNISDPDFCLI